jgi:hypothetical protein
VSTKRAKKIELWKCDQHTASTFDKMFDSELDDNDGSMQIFTQTIQPTAVRFIKLVIKSAHDDFAAVSEITAQSLN